MNIRRKRFNSIRGTCIVALVYGLGGIASRVDAQTAAAPVAAQSTINGAPTSKYLDPQNSKLRKRVAAALHAQPYLDDRHIDVSVHGRVLVLSGIVSSDWDLQDTLRV